GKKINWKQLPPDISNILKMVIVRFMQVFFPPYVSDIQKIILVYEKHHFLCQGKTIIDMGWKALDELLPSKKKTNNDNDIEIPAIQVNDSRTLKSAKIKEDKTKPPEQYTDASLLSAMENAGKLVDDEELKSALKDRGLGTPATRAAIIERLIKVGYVQRQKKYFVPTDKGKKLISVVPNEISSAELTGNWECKLSDIANKSEDSKNLSLAFLNGIRNFTNSLVNGYQINTAIQFEAETKYKKKTVKGLGTCPLCKKGQVLENSKGFYCSRWRENCKFTIWKNTLERNNGPTINAQIIELLLKDSQVKGSSGTILLNGDKVEFQSK
ncbi:MAG: DNA topoisomerase, partial [Eubacteriales bacterium]|nr:DNA topoisomerase [Eubacteriales bacterium]